MVFKPDAHQESSGVAKAGLATAIPAAAVAGLSAIGSVVNAYNEHKEAGKMSDCFEEHAVRNCDLAMVRELMDAKNENSMLKAEKVSDQKFFQLNTVMLEKFGQIDAKLAAQDVTNKGVADSFQIVTERMDHLRSDLGKDIACTKQDLESQIKSEAACRKCNDEQIVCYVNRTFVPQTVCGVKCDTDSARTMSTYNPLPACCDCGCK